MSKNPQSKTRSATAPCRLESPHGQSSAKQWEQMVLELIACSNHRPGDPGRFDEVAIARYLSGRCSSEEQGEIERAIAKSPELSECIALASEALAKSEAAA